jgi:hypothetical protein
LSDVKGSYYLSSEHSENAGGGLVTSLVAGSHDPKNMESKGVMVIDDFEMDERYVKDMDLKTAGWTSALG